MRIKDIINESATDVVARFYREAGDKYDKFFNPEDMKYKEQNKEHYEKHFKKWFKEEVVPVFLKPTEKAQPPYTNIPKQNGLQSPGFRGLQYSLAKAGLPYDHGVQKYDPSPAKMIAPQVMDGARNNNGQ